MENKTTITPEKSETSSFERLIEVGIALSAERDTNRLLETILLGSGLINRDRRLR